MLSPPDTKMLELIDLLQSRGKIRFRQEFLDTIGMLKQNYTDVINGKRSFRVEHIAAACQAYNVNANWVLGLEEKIWNTRRAASVIGRKQP